jgi:hypothetical protein
VQFGLLAQVFPTLLLGLFKPRVLQLSLLCGIAAGVFTITCIDTAVESEDRYIESGLWASIANWGVVLAMETLLHDKVSIFIAGRLHVYLGEASSGTIHVKHSSDHGHSSFDGALSPRDATVGEDKALFQSSHSQQSSKSSSTVFTRVSLHTPSTSAGGLSSGSLNLGSSLTMTKKGTGPRSLPLLATSENRSDHAINTDVGSSSIETASIEHGTLSHAEILTVMSDTVEPVHGKNACLFPFAFLLSILAVPIFGDSGSPVLLVGGVPEWAIISIFVYFAVSVLLFFLWHSWQPPPVVAPTLVIPAVGP